MGEEELLFSEHHACPHCGFSIGELEPRMFSFNSPFGACPSCDGLGSKLEVDLELVIPNWDLSLNEHAIAPWEPEQAHNITHSFYNLYVIITALIWICL